MSEAEVIDLDAVATAAALLAAWWAYFCRTGDPALAQLDQARRALAALPPLAGSLGRAVRLVASTGRHATSGDIQAAIERISAAGTHRHTTQPTAPLVPVVGPVEQLSFAIDDGASIEAGERDQPVKFT
jgi:hypothetical protein